MCDMTEECKLAPESGRCRARIQRYYYDPATDQCRSFIYGGCHGNDNRFDTVAECEAHCMRQPAAASNGECRLCSNPSFPYL